MTGLLLAAASKKREGATETGPEGVYTMDKVAVYRRIARFYDILDYPLAVAATRRCARIFLRG